MSRRVDQNSRENSDFYPQKPVKPVYSCIFLGFFPSKFPGISWRAAPKCRENFKFSRKFPGKSLDFGSKILGNPYILVFLGVLSTKIPGNSWKGRPQIFVKTRNFDKNFPGKIWLLTREFRETRIFLHFWVLRWSKFQGIFVEGSLISGCFDENWEFRKIWNFQEITIFSWDYFFFVKYSNPHFIMSFIIVWAGYTVYKKYIMLTLDEYRHCLTKSGNLILIFCNLGGSLESDELGDPWKLTFT